jgi:hypothetical protein
LSKSKSSPTPIHIPSCCFAHIHTVIVGPLPSSQGKTHILTLINRTTCWARGHSSVLHHSSQQPPALKLFGPTGLPPFGIPQTITSDKGSQLGLTRESLFEILARSETCFLDPKFSRDFGDTCESKLVARLASCESHRQKFCSENCEKRVSLRNFVARIASYESHRKKFCSKTHFSRVSQTNFVARLASLANKNFVARLAKIITNFNSGVLREPCKNFESNTNFSL